LSKYYKISGNKLEKLKTPCPRCGDGYWMAEHYDRFSCGKCGYTEFKKRESKENEKESS
jgi:small subunit ribosomal protein S27Ae